jgi:dephospho-CoA kinase
VPILSAPIFLLSGSSKVGKTSIARKLADAIGCPTASFGDYVRSRAVTVLGGGSATRQQLQELGQQLVTKDAESFCRSVLSFGGFKPGEPFVLDGLRHLQVLPAIQSIAPDGIPRIIYLEAPTDLRIARWDGAISASELSEVDSHPVEADLVQIRKMADIVIDTQVGIERSVSDVMVWVSRLYPSLAAGRKALHLQEQLGNSS